MSAPTPPHGDPLSGAPTAARRTGRVAGRREPLDVDPRAGIRFSWAAPAAGPAALVVLDDGVEAARLGIAEGRREALLDAGVLDPARRYRWVVERDGRELDGGRFGTGPLWDASVPVWARPVEARWDDGSVVADYDIEVRAAVTRPAQTAAAPAVGVGMDVRGARRFDVLLRFADQRNGYVLTVDPEAGELVAARLVDEAEETIGTARWTPSTDGEIRVLVSARGPRIVTRVDGAEVLSLDDTAFPAGAVGLGAPRDTRSRILGFTVTDAAGVRRVELPAGDVAPIGSVAVRDGWLELAERSRGLVPSRAEWAFLRTEFELPDGAEPAWATLFATASSAEPGRQLVFRASVNGVEVGTGPVRSVGSETRYDGFDATDAVRPGANALSVVAWTSADQRFQAELVIGLSDGTTRTIGTTDAWRGLAGDAAHPTRGSIGTGYFAAPREDLDASAYPWGLDAAGFDDASWPGVVVRHPFGELRPNPAGKVRAERVAPERITRPEPGVLSIDVGHGVVGGIAIPAEALRGIPDVDLELRFGEALDAGGRVRSTMSTGNRYVERWSGLGAMPPGSTATTWGLRSFRHVEVIGWPEGADAAQIEAIGHVYPLGEPSVVSTSDPVLDGVLDFCRTTMVQANGALLVDSWNREREPYEADAYLQTLCNAAVSDDDVLGSYALDYLLVRRTWPTEWPFYLVLLAWERYLRFGDLDALRGRRDALAAILPERWIDPAMGLVRKTEGSDGSSSRVDHDIVDWPPSERDGYVFGPVNTVVNAIAHGAYAAMARIDDAIGRAGAERWAGRAAGIRSAVDALLWDEAAGAYRDGLDADGRPIDHHAAHAGAFVVAMGAAADERLEAAGAGLAARGMTVSVYGAPFLLDALVRCGRVDAAYALLTGDGLRSWRAMMADGAGATMEAWSESLKPNVSRAHPWAASPLFVVTEMLAGVVPTAPGYASADIVPRLPSRLSRLSVRVPTAAGTIGVALRREGDALDVRAEAPAGCRTTLRLVDGWEAGGETVIPLATGVNEVRAVRRG